jgi:hypothetical protein
MVRENEKVGRGEVERRRGLTVRQVLKGRSKVGMEKHKKTK